MPRVVTCLLENEGKILLLKRSERVKTYRRMWGGVAGYIEENEDPYEAAIKEIKEEAGIDNNDFRLIKQGDPISFIDVYEGKEYEWTVFPFLFKIKSKEKIQIDWEHSNYEWIVPSDIKNYDTVPRLKEIVLRFFQ
jgi:8-oxo-dGTP pyrophosphatase MutT (NUDIX family)